jgi:hypothetical protein
MEASQGFIHKKKDFIAINDDEKSLNWGVFMAV